MNCAWFTTPSTWIATTTFGRVRSCQHETGTTRWTATKSEKGTMTTTQKSAARNYASETCKQIDRQAKGKHIATRTQRQSTRRLAIPNCLSQGKATPTTACGATLHRQDITPTPTKLYMKESTTWRS